MPVSTETPRFIIVDPETIRISRDEEDGSRAKKRKRANEDDAAFSPFSRKGPETDGTQILIHDPTYYSEDPDADCYVRVEKILFKVHRHCLLMSSYLRSRLSDKPTSGREPLELFGISVAEFRALLWARYASDADVKDLPKTQDDMTRLLLLATATQTCDFHELHSWTMKTIYTAFTTRPTFTDACTSATLTRTVEVASRCKATDLLDAAAARWSDRLRRKTIPAVPAILIADTYNLRGLRGIAYYTYIQEILDASPPQSTMSAIHLQADPKLSNTQLIKLLSGYLSLVSLWERRRRTPTSLECSEGCSTEKHRTCARVWEARWSAVASSRTVIEFGSSDVLGILLCMCERLDADPEVARSVAPACREAGLEALRQEICDIRGALPEHFVGCM
ncbi:hypothetical protein Hypma_016391 [Hypsizygus marmoreus]|uniref:BTB domain-containing protein n=1 Tax=Hypsizygus marmoreus TaxID=39966 RepID=A0A369J600_HYPMA|nr:hypothetical protein Hypma_016391 [Hypsizygus marmoreus]